MFAISRWTIPIFALLAPVAAPAHAKLELPFACGCEGYCGDRYTYSYVVAKDPFSSGISVTRSELDGDYGGSSLVGAYQADGYTVGTNKIDLTASAAAPGSGSLKLEVDTATKKPHIWLDGVADEVAEPAPNYTCHSLVSN